MKKLIFLILIVITIVLAKGFGENPYEKSPYTGKYASKYNTILELHK